MNRSDSIRVLCLLLSIAAAPAGCGTDSDDGDTLLPPWVQIDHLEAFRPQLHYTPLSGWMNDPNGLVRVGDTWNLYHQYIPGEYVLDRMDWGHATSTDLVHWTYQPTALQTNPDLGMAYSGSAIVDEGNMSGFCGDDPMRCVLAFFTHSLPFNSDQKQSLAISRDGGLTFAEYDANPIMPNPGITNFRDPKVFLYDESTESADTAYSATRLIGADDGPLPTKWVMALAQGRQIGLYISANLLEWQPLSTIDNPETWMGVWECPDLVRLPVENEPGTCKWVLIVSTLDGAPWGGSGVQYIVGDFDGTSFTPDDDLQTQHWLDHGWDFYAPQTFSNVPADDGRTVMIGWMNNWKYALGIPAMPWQGAMAIPRQLKLTGRADGTYALLQEPVAELATLRRGRVVNIDDLYPTRMTYQDSGDPADWMFSNIYTSDSGLYEINVTGPRQAVWDIRIGSKDNGSSSLDSALATRASAAPAFDATLTIGVENGWLIVDRGNALCDDCPSNMGRYYTTELTDSAELVAAGLSPDTVTLKILVDRSGVEVFADGGRTAMTALTFMSGTTWNIALEAWDETGENDTVIGHIDIYEMMSIWAVQ